MEHEPITTAVDALAPLSAKSSDRILEPMDRISEVLFGLIMALTFTLTLGVVTADRIHSSPPSAATWLGASSTPPCF